ncbi:hypothetical protein DL96DRAFT_1580931 [Flagelloscypha sp. PMI_526]|nr:hypothetical protein DL96DRAFT_1580931 [Flagelloscypha sp. PMI_526]
MQNPFTEMATSSRTNVLCLPPEIIHFIISYFEPTSGAGCTNRKYLSKYSRMHSAFRYPSQSMLFRTIALTTESQFSKSLFWTDAAPLRFAPYRFLSLLDMSPHIAALVHTLHLDLSPNTYERQDILEIIMRLRGVPSLSLRSVSRRTQRSWDRIPSSITVAITSILLPEIQELSLDGFLDVPFEMLSNARGLRNLRLTHVEPSVSRDITKLPSSTPPAKATETEIYNLSVVNRGIGNLLIGRNSFTQFLDLCTMKRFEFFGTLSAAIIDRLGDKITHLTYRLVPPPFEADDAYSLSIGDVPNLHSLTCTFGNDFWPSFHFHSHAKALSSHMFPSIFMLSPERDQLHPLRVVHVHTVQLSCDGTQVNLISEMMKFWKQVHLSLQNSRYVNRPVVKVTMTFQSGITRNYTLENTGHTADGQLEVLAVDEKDSLNTFII